MDKINYANRVYNRSLTITNIVTCIYIPAVFALLYFTGQIYNIGKCENFYVVLILIFAEITKYLCCYMKMDKNIKLQDVKKYKLKDHLKNFAVYIFMTVVIYIISVLFGAPFLSKQEETMMFSMIVCTFTVLPMLLHFGPETVTTSFTNLMAFEGVENCNKFLLAARLTILGAWLGSILIPLDWNKPYQNWPIPCCFGAIGGFFIANFCAIFMADDKIFFKRPTKFNL